MERPALAERAVLVQERDVAEHARPSYCRHLLLLRAGCQATLAVMVSASPVVVVSRSTVENKHVKALATRDWKSFAEAVAESQLFARLALGKASCTAAR